MTERKYDAKYDIVKFILSVFVVAIHASLYPRALYPWLRVAVPLFFMMSSYFLFSKLNGAPAEQHKGILKKFVSRNLALYLCWFVILLPITLYVRKDAYFSNGLWENLLNIVRSIFFGSTFAASWFITATVLGVLVVYYLHKWLRKDFLLLIVALVAFCIVTLESSYSVPIAGTFIETVVNGIRNVLGSLTNSFPAAIFWVFMGKLFAEKKIQFQSTWLLVCLLLCSCAGLYLEWRYVATLEGAYNNDSYFMLLPVCIFLFAGIQKIKPIYWGNSSYFKHASTVIYVCHASLLVVIKILLPRILPVRSALLEFAVALVGCAVATAVVEMLNKKLGKYKIGKILKLLY